MNRKRFIKILSLGALSSFWAWAFVVEPHFMLKTEHVEVPLENWDPKLNGLKIAVIGDIHAGWGPHEMRRLQKVVDEVNAQKPDIIMLVGDYVNGAFYQTKMDEKDLIGFFSQMHAPLGKYAILGNHDVYYGPERVREMLKEGGFTLLENSNAKVSTPNGDFYIAGIADPITSEYYYEPTLAGIPKGAPVIFLSHAPDVLREIPYGISIMFSGHTHGGQVVLPYLGAIFTNSTDRKEYVSGLVREDGKVLYTTRGVGTSRIPIRFNCPPEVSIITLVKGDESGGGAGVSRMGTLKKRS